MRRYIDPRSKIAGIVIATFVTKELRGVVKAAEVNLAGNQAGRAQSVGSYSPVKRRHASIRETSV